MELLLPKKTLPKKKYKHFTLDPYRVPANEPVKRIDFFYIGVNAQHIDFLVRSFEGGYALESIAAAIPFLKRHLDQQIIPGLIILDGKCDIGELEKLQDFLHYHTSFSAVPVIMDSSILSADELKKPRTLLFIDEIISFEAISREKLLAKADFLRKVKSRAGYSSLQAKVHVPVRSHYTFSLILKRIFDIAASSVALLILSPFLLVIALLIKLESKGPVFYIAPRAGKGYKIFNFFKFRTMVVDADKKVDQLSHLNQYAHQGDGPVFFKLSNDPRITKIGSFLRNTSLDELPQLLNVLLGDMSLVGNRPLPLYEAAMLTTDVHAARFMAPAGITGLWQIKKRGDSNMSVEERISLDIIYARKFSFIYDLWIIANTPTALMQKENV